MSQSSTQPTALPTRQIIRELIHARMTEAIEVVLEQELAELLGSTSYERTESREGIATATCPGRDNGEWPA